MKEINQDAVRVSDKPDVQRKRSEKETSCGGQGELLQKRENSRDDRAAGDTTGGKRSVRDDPVLNLGGGSRDKNEDRLGCLGAAALAGLCPRRGCVG